MKILLLAPQPYFQERGTPIDVFLLLRALSEEGSHEVDVVSYAGGSETPLPRTRFHRTPDLRPLRGVRPGFSLKKVLCDGLLFFKAWSLVRRNDYDLVHAVEESVFMARFFERLHGIPYAYDLDSSVAQQMIERRPLLRPLRRFFVWMERRAVRGALINLPVCNELAALCERHGSRRTLTLHDISQLERPGGEPTGALRAELGADGTLLLYVGNLEPYQGIDLLLESFALAARESSTLRLAIIGGAPEDVERYRRKAAALGVGERTHLLGPRPLERIDDYLLDAGILVCPRIRGINTPMKVFSYLHSGRPLLATDLVTHNQILTSEEALLAPADPRGFADGMLKLAADPELRRRLGRNGIAFVERQHTYEAHRRRVREAYGWIRERLDDDAPAGEASAVREGAHSV